MALHGRVMVVYLHMDDKDMEFNGRVGIIFTGSEPSVDAQVCVRLDGDHKELSLERKNVFSIDPPPTYTQNSPAAFGHPTQPWWFPAWNYLRVAAEPGKGDGIMVQQKLCAGMLLRDRPEGKQMYFFQPAGGGVMYESSCYAFKMNALNMPVLCVGIQKMVDAAHGVLAQAPAMVCCDHERYVGELCAHGGCTKCGISVLAMGAMRQASLCHMQEHAKHRFVVDEKLFLHKLQLTEILMLVDFIVAQTEKMALTRGADRAECTRLQADFIHYVWDLVGVWKTNAFEAYLPVAEVATLLDPLFDKKKEIWKSHIADWKQVCKSILLDINSGRVVSAEEKCVLIRKVELLRRRIEETDTLVEPVIARYGAQTQEGKYDMLGYAAHVTLYTPYITKINGAKEGDIVNCSVVDFIYKHTGSPTLPDDMETYLRIDRHVAAGDFLCVAYNREKLHKDDDTYFTTRASHSIKEQVARKPLLAAIVQDLLSDYKLYLPDCLACYLASIN